MALVHDVLLDLRGAERVYAQRCAIFRYAPNDRERTLSRRSGPTADTPRFCPGEAAQCGSRPGGGTRQPLGSTRLRALAAQGTRR